MKALAYILTYFVLSFGVTSCKNRHDAEELVLPTESFCDGDIAFRRGTGIMSRIVVSASKNGVYSHIGILKKNDGKWFVIHAVPDEPDFKGDPDRVKIEPVARFFAPDKAFKGAVMRYTGKCNATANAARRALEFARRGTPFDHEYDLNDTTAMYCTELVDYVYKKEGIDLSEGRIRQTHLPIKGEVCLLPDDLAANRRLTTIFSFSR